MKSLTFLLCLALAAPASAALVKIHARYDRLDLKDGRQLANVTVQTYDTMTDRVMVLVDGEEATTVPLATLPDDVAAVVRDRIPLRSEDEMAADGDTALEERAPAEQERRELERQATPAARSNQAATRVLNERRAELEEANARQTRTLVATSARELARHYFTYEANPHSSTGAVLDSSIILQDPEPVPGWTNRWRVRGKVGTQSVTRNLGATHREAKDFEMLIDAPPGHAPELIEVTVDR